MSQAQKKETRCTARQENSRVPDFECKLNAGAHNIHIDPRTGQRWGDGMYPRGFWRKWARRKYANSKLSRQAAVATARGAKERLR